MKKKTMAILGGIAAAVLFAALVTWWYTDYSNCLKLNWGFSLPLRAGYTEVYAGNTPSGIHGDGIRYHVFSYKREAQIETMFRWTEEEAPTRRHLSYRKAAEAWLGELDVPAEFRPDYENCVYWYEIQSGNDEIIVFWDETADTVAMLEFFL